MRIQNFYSLNLDVHAQLPASPNMVAVGSTNRLHSGAEYGGAVIVLVLILLSTLNPDRNDFVQHVRPVTTAQLR